MNLYTDQHQAIEAEVGVIGSVFLNNDIMDNIADWLEPRDFTVTAHEIVWEVMKYYHKHNKPIDFITMVSRLNELDMLELAGGVEYLTQLTDTVPTSLNARHYADIVRSRAYRKRGTEAGMQIMELAKQNDIASDEEYFQQIEKIALSIRPSTNGDMKLLSETRKEYFDYLATKDDFIFTRFKQFDTWMGGIGRGWLYILAGRPSVGKTARVLQMSVGIAEQEAGPVAIWSQEMKRNQLLNRMLAPISGVNGNRIRRKELEPEEIKRITEAYDYLEKLPIHIEDAKNVTIEEVRATARQLKRKYGKIGAIIVDYLTIMKIVQQKGETRSQAVGYVTRTAKQIALEMDCPFIMLAQLSREGAGEPKLEHLRDSGEIEQDADVVEFLWHNPDETHRDGKVIQSIIAKGRDVGVNQFKYLFKGWIQKYEELAK